MSKPQHTPKLNNELQFLIACCQTTPTKNDINIIQTYLNTEGLDQNALIALANQHGVLPLVYKTLKSLFEDTSPRSLSLSKCNPQLLPKLKAHYQSIAQRNMLMSAELIRIMQLLEDNNIEALSFKGPTLAQLAYGDITLRQFVDLDILIHKKDIYKIDTLLQTESYERLFTLTSSQEEIWINHAHDMGLIHKQKGVHFEIHWSFLDEDYPMQVNLEYFWKETKDITLNRLSIPTFSNENLLYYLCIHGSKHLWERIEWVKDIDLLIRHHDIDWKKVVKNIEGTGFEKMVYLGLYLSTTLFQTPLPTDIQKEITNFLQMGELSTFIFKSWSIQKSTFQRTSTMLKLFPTIKIQILYLYKTIFKPSLNEYYFINLPKKFYLGYYLVRPYLLVKKYFFTNK